MTKAAIVIGASGGLGQAVLACLCERDDIELVVAVSRSEQAGFSSPKLKWLAAPYTDEGMEAVVSELQPLGLEVSRVVICNGILHTEQIQPEKRLEDVSMAAMVEVFKANTAVPVAWLKALLPLLKGKQDCVLAAFSARVGSIGDNRLGGWYSYRASKSALNMLLKTASIEFARRAKNVKLIAFHPGTTDTALSKPFQQSVPEGKLFEPEFVAKRLLGIMDSAPVDGELDYVDWDGKPIDW